jgi:hypothetical protein
MSFGKLIRFGGGRRINLSESLDARFMKLPYELERWYAVIIIYNFIYFEIFKLIILVLYVLFWNFISIVYPTALENCLSSSKNNEITDETMQ